MKITVIGRPDQIEQRDTVVITTLTHTTPKQLSLPKGVPQPPQEPTTYAVYIASKQWNKVAEAIANPEDVLIIEGHCAYDPALPGIAVFATNVTTKLTQRAKPAEPKTQQPDPVPTQPQHTPRPTPTKQLPAQTPTKPANPLSAADAAKKLAALRTKEDELRQQLADLKALPPEEQIGLGQIVQTLQKVKAEIKQLLQEYPN